MGLLVADLGVVADVWLIAITAAITATVTVLITGLIGWLRVKFERSRIRRERRRRRAEMERGLQDAEQARVLSVRRSEAGQAGADGPADGSPRSVSSSQRQQELSRCRPQLRSRPLRKNPN